MANPPRSRAASPILRLFDAGRRVYAAELDAIAAARDTAAAAAAGRCVTCGAPVSEPEAKLCDNCAGDVAQAGAELATRAVGPALEAGLRELLGGRRLPRR